MLLVIFGAGASFDSVSHHPVPRLRVKTGREEYRLPLANELFEDRPEFVQAMHTFRECKPIIPHLRKSGVAVERELANIQKQSASFPKAHQELMAIRFYLQVAIWRCQKLWHQHHLGINNYVTLLREIERWRYEASETACLVSFNYDTLLEEALHDVVGFKTDRPEDYIRQTNYSLIKLHGSINWGMNPSAGVNSDQHFGRIIENAAAIKLSNIFVTVNMTFDNIRGLIPAISIPVEQKDEFCCPDPHVKYLQELLPSVTKVLIVGWRATEADFLRMLHSAFGFNQRTRDLMIVSGDDNGANETFNNLGFRNFSYPGQNRVANGFTGLINNTGLLDSFLRHDFG